MNDLVIRDVEYRHEGTRMLGQVCAPAGDRRPIGVLLIHDAFGLSPEMTAHARRLAAAGYPVFLADVWGERTLPRAESEIGPLIGGMVADRDRWLGRIGAARTALAAQPELAGSAVVPLGYCFGGSSVLEYVRTGAEVAGAISVHGGLDLLAPDWSAARPTSVLICTGADDPMATAPMRDRLTGAMDAAGMDWQVHLYSDTKHAFTSPMAQHSPMPDVVAYHPRSAARAWRATLALLGELADPTPLN